MGCSPSKLDSDDTVRRCKDRRLLMTSAVHARHHLSSAHSAYLLSLKSTGAALSAFAAGQNLSVSGHTPAVLLRTPMHTQPPPTSTTNTTSRRRPPPRRRKPIKLPHILSDSSFSSSPPYKSTTTTTTTTTDSNYSTTASQNTSLWDWDHFYPPPSPPNSDDDKSPKTRSFSNTFDQNHNPSNENNNNDEDNDDNKSPKTTSFSNTFDHNQQSDDDRSSHHSSHSRNSNSNNNHAKKHTEKIVQNSNNRETEAEREEVQCSEWGDHNHDHDHDNGITTSSSSDENIESVRKQAAANSKYSSKSEKLASEDDDDDGKSSVNWGNISDRRVVVRHKDLVEIVEALREYFDQAALAGEQVSEMLESGRAQLDRSFKQLRKTIYHSSGMLSNLSSSWTSKPPLAVKYRFEPSSIEQSGGPKSLCSTLERLLAWEKKLYQEVKAREGVKIEHEKKLSTLQSQEYRGEDEAKLDKTKASIKRLQSLILVTSQAVSTTSFAIIGLRDSDLVPQLVELCHGSMHQSHHIQNIIVQQVRGLVNMHTTRKAESTSDLHHQATRGLEAAVATWHSSFCRLIKFQRDFIRSLHGWFKLALVPVDIEPIKSDEKINEALAFFDEWRLAFERIPDTVASEAIKSFENVVRSISSKQTDEMKLKKRAEVLSKEVEKRASSIRSIEKRCYDQSSSYSTVGLGVSGDDGIENGHVLDVRDPLAEKKAELATWRSRVEDEMVKHAKAVEVARALTLNNIQTGLPGVFQAMTGFSGSITQALEKVCTRSYEIIS